MTFKKILDRQALVVIAVLSLRAGTISAQTPTAGTSAKDSAAYWKSAVEANPNDRALHEKFIEASGGKIEKLASVYDAWIKRFPKSAIVPFAIGHAYANKESAKARPYLLKAVALDPGLTDAWGDLWFDADRWGDFESGKKYLQKATESDPSNASYAFYYAGSFKDKDPEKYRALSEDVARRFPGNERGAQALYWLAAETEDKADKIKAFELLKNSFSPEKYGWSSSGMTLYYEFLLSEDPAKAVVLAQEMEPLKGDDAAREDWPGKIKLAQQVAGIKELLGQKKGAEALVSITAIKLPRYSGFKEDLILLKAEAIAESGNIQAAYDSLIAAFTKSPGLKIKEGLSRYGGQSGKDAAQIDEDVYRQLLAASKPATPFTLKRYLTPGKASLSDYKGKVVLLTYWFPGCGPCRAEFPHFEKVLRKFKGRPVDYLGINVDTSQNAYVLSFMRQSGYTFTPLEEVKDRVKGNLDNGHIAPANFLIDQQGRLLFSGFRIEGNNEQLLEKMINLALEHTASTESASLKNAVEMNPDSLTIHENYINAIGINNPELEAQYTAWINKYPHNANIPFALGNAYANHESPKARPWLLKAVALNPALGKAWQDLWIDAERWGDNTAAGEYLRKAVEADPSDAGAAFYYANSFRDIDREKYLTLSLEVVKKFPENERGAQTLYWLGAESANAGDKIRYYELLRSTYPPEKFSWSANGMDGYFDVLLETAPEKAILLAQDMAEKMKKDSDWAKQITVAQNISRAKQLLGEKKGAEAVQILGKTVLNKYSGAKEMFQLLKAEAEDMAGNVDSAYNLLLVFFTKEPRAVIKEGLLKYGMKLGKSTAQMDADIWKRLDDSAQVATSFTLKRYLTPGSASLADYQGKVVLLTYWFPGCGPCRGEMPHFENVYKKFKGQNVDFIGINIDSSQNAYVVPFVRSTGYSFTPLEDFKGRQKGNLANMYGKYEAAPVNFLIDQDGRLIFSKFTIGASNEDELELMMSMMLAHKKG